MLSSVTLGRRHLQYNTIQDNTAYRTIQPIGQYSTVQYSTRQYSTVQDSTVQYRAVQDSTIQDSTVQYRAVQGSTVQYSTTRKQPRNQSSSPSLGPGAALA